MYIKNRTNSQFVTKFNPVKFYVTKLNQVLFKKNSNVWLLQTPMIPEENFHK